jgi:hypothetical protein
MRERRRETRRETRRERRERKREVLLDNQEVTKGR